MRITDEQIHSIKITHGEYAGINKFARSPCGATAIFNTASGIGYTCQDCFAEIGSVGCPCKWPEQKK